MGYDIYNRGNLEHKKWIGLTYDYAMMIENLTQADCLVCLTEFELAWLQANVQYMRWSSRWTNCPCTPEELNDMADILERKLMSCIEINPYQTDYIYNQTVSDQLGVFNADYTGLPSSVNPDAPDDFFSGNGSSDRITGLCDACKVYVYSYASNWVQKAKIILGAVFVVTAIASLTLLGGVIAGTVLAGLALISQIALDAMEDEQALDDIVCCMVDAMTGTVINQANFEASLDACGFTVGSNQAIARDIVASDLTVFDNYLSFLNALGDQYVLAQAGVSDCPCETTWIKTFDFTLGKQGWDFVATRGSYVVGVGFVGIQFSSNETAIYIEYPNLPVNTVTQVQESGSFVGDPTVSVRSASLLGFDIAQSTFLITQYTQPNSAIFYEWNTDTQNYGLKTQIYNTGFAPSPPPIVTISSMTVKGTGINPFP